MPNGLPIWSFFGISAYNSCSVYREFRKSRTSRFALYRLCGLRFQLRRTLDRASSLIVMSDTTYLCVVLMSSWPSHIATVAISTPAASMAMAVEWRKTCGVTFLRASSG